MTRVVLIDDEADARYTLRRFLDQLCPDVTVISEAESVEEGIALIHQQQPDLLLLDITMKDGSGFDLLDQFPNPAFQVIFTTGSDDFAIKAFKYNALDYLLKPIDPDELVQAIEKIKNSKAIDFSKKIEGLLTMVNNRQFNKITLSSSEGLIFLQVDHIIHLSSEGNYTTVFTNNNERHIVVKTLKEFEELLPSSFFYRTHQSHLINLNFVKKYMRNDGGYLLMTNGNQVSISRRRKEVVLQLLIDRNS